MLSTALVVAISMLTIVSARDLPSGKGKLAPLTLFQFYSNPFISPSSSSFKDCPAGQRQSPIAIRANWTVFDPLIGLTFHRYDAPLNQFAVGFWNDRLVVNFTGDQNEAPSISGSALHGKKYSFGAMELHVGLYRGDGSEHMIDARKYDMEVRGRFDSDCCSN